MLMFVLTLFTELAYKQNGAGISPQAGNTVHAQLTPVPWSGQ